MPGATRAGAIDSRLHRLMKIDPQTSKSPRKQSTKALLEFNQLSPSVLPAVIGCSGC